MRYAWLTCRRELLWFPAALLGAFLVIAWMMRLPEIRFMIARGYLGFFVPLVAGITAAYAVLDDPALELRFATATRHARTLLTRFALIMAIQVACALGFQLFAAGMGVDFTPLGGAAAVQAAWLVPTLALATLGLGASLATAHCAVGAFVAAAVWLVQLLMKGWVLANLRHAYIFMGILEPRHPDLAASQMLLVAASLAALGLGWAFLHKQERYL